MSIEAIDADLARASAASLRLAAAMAQLQVRLGATPGDIERGYAAVRVAEADLASANAAVRSDQAASGAPHPTVFANPATVPHAVELVV